MPLLFVGARPSRAPNVSLSLVAGSEGRPRNRRQDLLLLDTRQTEGGGDWSGSFVGTSFIFSHNAKLGTLEGDPRFYFDDSLTPQGQGTGGRRLS